MAPGFKTGGRQKGTPNRQTAAEKAAFALEAAAKLDAEGIDVLDDLTTAYLLDDKPMPHTQRFGYTMLRHLERARTAQAIAARQAREAALRGDPPPVLVPAAAGQHELLDPLEFLSGTLAEAEQELEQSACGAQRQCAYYHLAKVQARIERLPCRDSTLGEDIALRLALSREFAASHLPPGKIIEGGYNYGGGQPFEIPEINVT